MPAATHGLCDAVNDPEARPVLADPEPARRGTTGTRAYANRISDAAACVEWREAGTHKIPTIVPFANGGNPIEMPNFLHFLPISGYPGEPANGIHQIAGGLNSGGTFGAPVSLGCIRLGRFQAKFARWWTPTQAKFFVHFEPNRYRKFGVKATGKARGFPISRTGKN